MTRGVVLPNRPERFRTFEEVPDAFFLGAVGNPPPLKTALTRVAAVERKHGVRVHLVDAKAVCGAAHLASALEHARRSHERGRPRARDLKVEVMLYLTGKRQIDKAIKAAGLSKATRRVGIAIEGAERAAYATATELLHEVDLSRDDSALEPSQKKALALRVSGTAEDGAGWEALALEVVAVLDLE